MQALDEVFNIFEVGSARSALVGWQRVLLQQQRGMNLHGCSEGADDGSVGEHEDSFGGRHHCF